MGVIDSFLNNSDLISKGFKHVMGLEKYIIVRDKTDQLVCYFHDTDDVGKAIVDEYLKQHSIDSDTVKREVKSIKKHDELYEKLVPYKIVVLDGKLVLYGEVVERAKHVSIKGYNGGQPKHGLNKYEIIHE